MSTTLRPRPAVGPPEPWDYPRFERSETSTGLPVWHRHLPNQPRLALQVLFDLPVDLELPSKRGIANLTSLTLDEGTTELTAAQFADTLDRAGATFGTGVDAAGLYVASRMPSWRWDEAMPLVAAGITDPVFPESEVVRLVHQRLDSIRREMITPESRAVREFRRHGVAGGHRLSWPTAGDEDTVRTLGRDDVVGFHRERMLSRALAVVLAGDLEGLDPVAEIERHLEGLGVVEERHDVTPVKGRSGPRTIVVDRPGAVQTALRIGRVGPDRSSPDWAALRLASYVLGGSITGRLNRVLREDKGFTYGMHSLVRSQRSGGFVVAATGSVHTEVTGEALRGALELTTELAEHGPSDEELVAARDALAGSQPLRTESVGSLAGQVAQALMEGLPHDHVATILNQVRVTEAEAVRAAAATHLRPDDMTVIAVGDASAIVDEVAAVGYGELTVIRSEGAPDG